MTVSRAFVGLVYALALYACGDLKSGEDRGDQAGCTESEGTCSTSTPFIGQSYYYVYFGTGQSGATSSDANDKYYVRCVRQGPLQHAPVAP